MRIATSSSSDLRFDGIVRCPASAPNLHEDGEYRNQHQRGSESTSSGHLLVPSIIRPSRNTIPRAMGSKPRVHISSRVRGGDAYRRSRSATRPVENLCLHCPDAAIDERTQFITYLEWIRTRRQPGPGIPSQAISDHVREGSRSTPSPRPPPEQQVSIMASNLSGGETQASAMTTHRSGGWRKQARRPGRGTLRGEQARLRTSGKDARGWL